MSDTESRTAPAPAPATTDAPCGRCAGDADAIGASRRAFLQQAAGAAALALVALGARPAEALARPLALVGGAPNGRARGAGATVAYPIPTADGAQVDRAHEVILVRWQNAVYAFALSCPHQNTALRWLDDVRRFQCPKHKSKYTPDGTFIEGRATRNMDRFAIARQGAQVVVDLDRLFESDEDGPAWAGAVVRVG